MFNKIILVLPILIKSVFNYYLPPPLPPPPQQGLRALFCWAARPALDDGHAKLAQQILLAVVCRYALACPLAASEHRIAFNAYVYVANPSEKCNMLLT